MKDGSHASLRAQVAHYYDACVRRHGPTPLGVDWSCAPTQQLRFVQLLRCLGTERPFTLTDVGCGYGALLEFMRLRLKAGEFRYLGLDVSPAMVDAARARNGRRRNAGFQVGHAPPGDADYVVASGIFNVKLSASTSEWEAYVRETLESLYLGCRVAMAVNFLLPDDSPGPLELYRSAPGKWVRFCEQQLGGKALLWQDYGLREFTLACVRPARSLRC